jgi:hypothetical protein
MSADDIEKDKLALEREKFQFEQTKHALDHQLEVAKQALEERKHTLETRKTTNEWWKGVWASLALAIPVFTAAATIMYGAWSLQRSAETAFATKAIELALVATSGPEAIGRAKVIAALYPALLPEGYEQRIGQLPRDQYGNPEAFPKMELMKLLVQQPAHRPQIVADWGKLYPDWAWLSQ